MTEITKISKRETGAPPSPDFAVLSGGQFATTNELFLMKTKTKNQIVNKNSMVTKKSTPVVWFVRLLMKPLKIFASGARKSYGECRGDWSLLVL